MDLTDSWGLKQMITDGTRKENVLDLVLKDSNNMVSSIDHIKNDKLSDHDTLIIYLDKSDDSSDKNKLKKNFCTTDIPLYKTDNLSVEQIVEAKEFLRNQD